MLQVKNIEKYYGSKNNVTKALDRISFEVADGEFIAIMGASGSGKTTLLNCISTIDTVSAGEILLDGEDIAELPAGVLAKFRMERLGFVFQDFSESARYRQQFMLLKKLGMERREMKKALWQQFAIYYAMPAIPPVLIGVPFIKKLAGATEPGVLAGASSPAAIIGTALVLFFLIYAVYILIAYVSLRRDVIPD